MTLGARSSTAWAVLALACAAAGCSDGDTPSGAKGKGGAAGTENGSAGSSGSAGTAGTAGTLVGTAARTHLGLVTSGGVARSANYTLYFAVGPANAEAGVMKSQQYRLEGRAFAPGQGTP